MLISDLQALAAQMRRWAATEQELADVLDDEGKDGAVQHWAKAEAFREAADMVDREIEREARDAEPDDDHDPDCDGTYIAPDAGFGGQDITYECQHPSHSEARDV